MSSSQMPPVVLPCWRWFDSSSNSWKIRLRPGGSDASGFAGNGWQSMVVHQRISGDLDKPALLNLGHEPFNGVRRFLGLSHPNQFVATSENWLAVNGSSSKVRGAHPGGMADSSSGSGRVATANRNSGSS